MRLVSDYMRDDTLRHALNELTRATFCFDFESWVTNGYFEGDYIPYSFLENGKIISNVSVNRMHFMKNGEEKHYIQLGTVMTAMEFRNQGLAAKLMKHVMDLYQDKCDGIYLFANLSALDFYRKLGFEERTQSRYSLKADEHRWLQQGEAGFEKVDPSDTKIKAHYLEMVRQSVPFGAFDQVNRFGLQLFYTAGLENAYYSKRLDSFAFIEQEEDTMVLQSVITKNAYSLKDILKEIKHEGKALQLGFVPANEEANMFENTPYAGEEEYRLFCMGNILEDIETEQLFFPLFSHA